jgi:hypothetical protein
MEFELLPEIYRVKLGDPITTDQITSALGFQFHEWITQANFPLKQAKNPWEDEIQFIVPGSGFTEEEGLWFLAMAKLDRPTYEHGIRLAQQYGKKATLCRPTNSVVFLHKPWRGPDRAYHVVRVALDEDFPWLNLHYSRGKFSVFNLLAGVRRRK